MLFHVSVCVEGFGGFPSAMMGCEVGRSGAEACECVSVSIVVGCTEGGCVTLAGGR